MDFDEWGLKDANNSKTESKDHYYGDIVRRLFLVGVFVMAITLPFLVDSVPGPIYAPIAILVIFDLVAGFVSPEQDFFIVLDFLISLGAASVFEYYAVTTFPNYSEMTLFFWTNQALAIIFLIALYYASKTLRGTTLEDSDK